MAYNIQELLRKCVELGASDLHITVALPPMYRIDGELTSFTEERLTRDATEQLAYSVMNEKQKKKFEQNKEVDFSFGVKDVGRFRANVYLQKGAIAVALRLIPTEIKSFDELKLPPVIRKLMDKPNGLILVTGPTGSGKSTTLAAMIDFLNINRKEHILTIEDPIEFVHKHKNCMVNQREVMQDTDSFSSALKVALRQDPDIVLVGELRDLETIQAALSIAETGHLTFGTLHTNSAAKSISRIVDVFPANQKDTIRAQLSMVLEAIISQTLIQKTGGGRVLATEIMVATDAIRALIRDDKTHQIPGMLEISQKDGMHTMNSDLARLYNARLITLNDAISKSPNQEAFKRLLQEQGRF